MANGNNKTTEWFIAKCKEKFPDYDYSKTIYVCSKTPLIITCPVHGDFIKLPSSVPECQICSQERRNRLQTGTQEDFITRSKLIHVDRFDYSRVDYKTARIKVQIRCKVHDVWFWQVPDIHVHGKGCKLCANDQQTRHRASTFGHFLMRARKVHGDRYEYSNVKYKNAKTNILVTCREHGDFTIWPDNHWAGSGCMACNKAGFKSDKAASLYVLRCGDITKVGITGMKPEKRCRQISRSFGDVFEVLKVFTFAVGNEAVRVEQTIIRLLRTIYESPSKEFDGYTECFYNVNLDDLLLKIETEIIRRDYGNKTT